MVYNEHILEDEDDFDPEVIEHYGMPRRSGRYPWGSGKTPFQSANNFQNYVQNYKVNNPNATAMDIAESMKMNSREYREYNSYYKNLIKRETILAAKAMQEKYPNMSQVAIAQKFGLSEGTFRSWMKPEALERSSRIHSVKERLENELSQHRYIDVGRGVGEQLGINREVLRAAVSFMEDEGWVRLEVKIPQVHNPNLPSTMAVLAPPGTTKTDIYNNMDQVHTIMDLHTGDFGKTWTKIENPVSIDSKRVDVIYGPEGGSDYDGLVKLRPGVDDLNLGSNNYAQVRIGVDGTHFIKGVAVYDPDLPKGKDVQVFSNKPKPASGDMHEVLKPMEMDFEKGGVDEKNPFGSYIKRQNDSKIVNIVNDAGDWDDWNRSLASQMLSKQPVALAKKQLDIVAKERRAELDEILSLTNPTVRKKLLESFADTVDSDAVDLKAAAMPGQATHVILPINSLKAGREGVDGKPGVPGEIFAPKYEDGTEVVLIRYPHAGTFEIPVLRVNNKNREARKLIGLDAVDAVGINAQTAAKMSGADFDGDAVLVIPNERPASTKIQSSNSLKALKDFDPHSQYAAYDGMKVIDKTSVQTEMGKITNLIADMNILGATHDELAQAVRHSMVVIDARKHKLDYLQSAKDNQITALKRKYQGSGNAGARTLISRATSEMEILDRRLANKGEGGQINPKTGELNWVNTGKTVKEYSKEAGGWVDVPKTIKIERLAYETDARKLMSSETGKPIERAYADHSNRLKALANEARKEFLTTPNLVRSPTAAAVYSREVSELEAALRIAKAHAPIERMVQRNTNLIVNAKIEASPVKYDKDELKKLKNRTLAEQRATYGAKTRIRVEPRHWEAIQAGAISDYSLSQILRSTDLEVIKGYATPRQVTSLTAGQIARAKAMLGKDGVTQAQIATALGVSTSTLSRALREEG